MTVVETQTTAVATVDGPPGELVEQINDEYRLAQAGIQTAFEHAITCGILLKEVRTRLVDGEWRGWIDENFEGSERTAQRYIQLADYYHDNPKAVAQLDKHHEPTITAAVASIAKTIEAEEQKRLRENEPPSITLPDDENVVDAEIVAEPTYSLTIAQLVTFAQKRWHRKPDEERVLAWLQAEGFAE